MNESKVFIYEDHVLFNKSKTTLIAYIAKETNYTIPNSVTTIGEHAFSGCDSLTSINIPNSITTIGNSAFAYCKSLTSINIPNNVTTIGEETFSDCDSLISINIPSSVTTIEDGAFRGCINLPAHIKSDIIQRFGEKVFDFDFLI